jgi:hypothetical protein
MVTGARDAMSQRGKVAVQENFEMRADTVWTQCETFSGHYSILNK